MVTHPGRFENLAQDRKKQLEILQLAQAQGLDPPSHHFELKTFQTVRCPKPKGNWLCAGIGQRFGAEPGDASSLVSLLRFMSLEYWSGGGGCASERSSELQESESEA